MTTYGYARVSTDAQDLSGQLEHLTAAGCERMFRDKVSGARADQPELQRMLTILSPGDVVVVTRFDRLARSTLHLLDTLKRIADAEGQFKSLAESWADTTTPAGRMMVTIIGGFAQFERELIMVRTREGLRRARERGVKSGPKPKLTSHQQREAICRRETGNETLEQIALSYHVSHSTISRLKGKAEEPQPQKPEKIDAETERAVRVFLQKLAGRYSVQDAILYGSRARRDHRVDSDADLVVVLKGEKGDRSAATRDMASLAFDAMLETGVLVAPLPLWESELERPELFRNPALLRNIERDGLRL